MQKFYRVDSAVLQKMSSTPGRHSLNDKLEQEQRQDVERALTGHERYEIMAEQKLTEKAIHQQHSKVPDPDPDVVDWDGPDDPANPKNW